MITSTARRTNASTRSEPVERSNFEVHVKTKSLALERSIEQQGRVIDEGRWGSGSFAFRLSDYRGSPSSISLACFKQEEQTKLMFISFSNGHGSTFENSLDSGY